MPKCVDIIDEYKDIVVGVYQNWSRNQTKELHQILLQNVFKLGREVGKREAYNNMRGARTWNQ